MVKSAGDERIDVEKIMEDIRRRIADQAKSLYSDEEIAEMINIDPGDTVDEKTIRKDFARLLYLHDYNWNIEPPVLKGEGILSQAAGIKGRLINIVRKIFWPFAKVTLNYGAVLHKINLLWDIYFERFMKQKELNSQMVNLIHNIILEMTYLKIENDRLRDGYQVMLRRIDQVDERSRQLEKMVLSRGSGKKR